MIDFSFGKNTDCERTNRRDFIRIGSLGLAGLTLPKLLEAQAAKKKDPAEERSVIFLWMQG
ncbi:MAG: DUF1501 domain-containing protein, partial [Planctomycetia bacterium]